MSEIKYNLTRESVTFIYEGKSYSVQKEAANFNPIREALLSENWNEVPKHLTIGKSIEEWAKGEFKVEGGIIKYKGEEIPYNLSRRIFAMAQGGDDPTPVFKFWERLQKNPSARSVAQLWDFLQHTNIPLTTNGTFYAYKGVKSNYKDAHSGTVDNSPGAINRMPRNKISDDPRVECHFGFHVGALGYARGFSELVVVCEVDPEHVVCVPYDQNSQKMRVCEYKVVGNYGGPLPSVIIIPDTEVDEFTETDHDDFENQKDAPKADEDEDDLDEDEDDDEDEDEEDEDLDDDEEPEEPTPAPVQVKEDKEAKKREKEEKAKAKEEREKARETREIDPDKRAAKKGYEKYTSMNMSELMKQSIDDLRQYAGKGLDIVGASKIAGGKAELVKRILKVRKRESK